MSDILKVNFADAQELQRIPGVGPKIAKSLITFRRLQGNITRELLEVLIKNPIPEDTLRDLDFSIRWDPETEAEMSESDGETMTPSHGLLKVKVEPPPTTQSAAGSQNTEVKELIELTKALLARQADQPDPVVRPKRLLPPVPKLASQEEDFDRDPRATSRSGRCVGRRSRLARHQVESHSESSDDADPRVARDLPLPTPVRGASTLSPTRKASRNILRDVPKSLSYDGKSNWQSFLLKFKQFAESSEWSEEDCRKCLLHCMTSKALDFCASHLRSKPEMSYRKLLQKLEGRFEEMLPDSAQAMFYAAKQKKGDGQTCVQH